MRKDSKEWVPFSSICDWLCDEASDVDWLCDEAADTDWLSDEASDVDGLCDEAAADVEGLSFETTIDEKRIQ